MSRKLATIILAISTFVSFCTITLFCKQMLPPRMGENIVGATMIGLVVVFVLICVYPGREA